MDYMISCPCGHTLEVHESSAGCMRCDCMRDRSTCLDAAIEIARNERVFYGSNQAARMAPEAASGD